MTTDKLAEALRSFTAWFTANYPGPDTIISDPTWHAPRIFRAARYALMLDDEAAQPAAQVVDEAMVERALAAYAEFAEQDGFDKQSEEMAAFRRRWLGAALTAALAAQENHDD